MSRRIIVVYNSRDAAMPDPQAKLLRTQLAEVEAEMRNPRIRGRALDRLTAERKFLKSKLGQKDGVGSFEEQAYGEGWHSESSTNPYTEASHKLAWEKGRAAKRQKFKMNSNARAGEVRGKRMEAPKARVNVDVTSPMFDYKSEKGFVAKLIDAQTGATLARSEPHISNGLGLKKWIQEEAEKLIKRGKRVKAEVAVVFFDPNMA